MTVAGFRWGTDDGGIACGPCGCSILAEAAVVDDHKLYFVMESEYEGFEQVSISPVSVFDLMRFSTIREVDFDYTLEKYRSTAEEIFDFQKEEDEFEWRGHRLEQAIRLVRLAVFAGSQIPDMDENSAYSFIEKYLDQDLNAMEIPDPPFACEDDEEEDEEE